MKIKRRPFYDHQATSTNLIQKSFSARDLDLVKRAGALLQKWVDPDLYPALLKNLLGFSPAFKRVRSLSHLSRLLSAQHLHKRKVSQIAARFPKKRHIEVKWISARLHYPFGTKRVLGLVITFNLLKKREFFDEQHVLAAVGRFLPSLRIVPGSLVDQTDRNRMLYSLYVEIERTIGEGFTTDEVKHLRKQLPEELKESIEQLVPVTFMRRNEEEVYKNILTLREQLRGIEDIPQMTLSFEEQTQFSLFFTIVLVRWVKQEEPSVQELLARKYPHLTYIPDRVDIVGCMKDQIKKEATVFRMELPKNQFYRKDRSVNLYKARQFCVMAITAALGQVRDYNGGLMLKQNERLEDFLSIVPKYHDEFVLENFFYSITPIAMQSILPASLLKEWFLGLSELMEQPKEGAFQRTVRITDEALFIFVRSEENSFISQILSELSRLEIPPLEHAHTQMEMYGATGWGFVFRPSQFGLEDSIIQKIDKTLQKWAKSLETHQVLRLCLHENEPSLDPRLAKADQSYILIKMLFDGLTRLDNNGHPQPAIAQNYKVTNDFKTYTFYLRESRWSNGSPITAYDFEYSWKKALSPKTHSVYSESFSLIKNARRALAGKCSIDDVGIEVVDEKTLKVELEFPTPYFLEVTAHWSYSLINSMIDRTYPGWAYQAGDTFVSNGPFKLAQWHHHRALSLEKNHEYWDAKSVHLSKIEVLMLSKEDSELRMLINGEIDMLGRPLGSFPNRKLESLHDDIVHVSYPLKGVFGLFFNVQQFPFNHKKIRKAFSMALERDAFSTLLAHEYGNQAHSILPKGLSLFDQTPYAKPDLNEAHRLFMKGLGEIGFVLSDFPALTLSYCSGMGRSEFFKSLQKTWEEVFGIKIFLEKQPWKRHFSKMKRGDYQIGCVEIKPLWGDPLHVLEYFESQFNPMNLSKWESSTFAEKIKQGRESVSLEERKIQLKEAELILAEELPVVPLYEISGNYLKRKELNQEFTTPYFQIDFKQAKKNHK